MTTPTSPVPSGPDPANGIILAPRPWVPLGLIALGLALLLLQRAWSWTPIAAGVVGLLGLVLLLQTLLLRLQFSGDALLVWSRSTLLRRFPYSEWIGWTLFWGPLPVLFYFRERRSPHLLPVLFDANALRQQLELHLSGLP
ncbi:DUF3119 family protein [Synechococcus sp. Cruz-9H2]|uniref:DUF3119 family protein n=1 Tax=unclassified Synechococcus TaxID=2626047 RepID=UPI0020CEF810|nr:MULTISPECIES: DUF3119 family protein [unclassified Synechococcus]MCP9820434.1 DUF3119 family protein [Synechococcus sp. Cruz-9H2]MCP9844703.1 DUF3119 family protein [Synechococcus sp. Edmonson 11F2]MCP9856864.1 DUF3119 family protein [Synechococcus sp. Cruz-9C9]MCP9864111.1 DUF3119 family protein [Synechococcus sp. Cruz-7E5]MCP9871306.1 DUF3119 family protein [Synechococcus sp. Cruz-7B9]